MAPPPGLAAVAERPWARPIVLVPSLLVLSLLGGLLPSFSWAANLYVLSLSGAVIWLGRIGRIPNQLPRRLPGAAAWWLLPAGLLALVELTDLALGSTDAHPTLSGLTDPLLDNYLARAVAYFIWLSGFWRLARR